MTVYHVVPDDVLRTLTKEQLQAYATNLMRESNDWTAFGGQKGECVFFRIPKGSRVWLIEKNGKHYIITDDAVPEPTVGTV